MAKSPLFHRAHFNILAKEIRDLFPVNSMFEDTAIRTNNLVRRTVLTELALNLARRFKAEREGYDGYEFDPLKFLDACSPNTDLYPLSELWEDDGGEV